MEVDNENTTYKIVPGERIIFSLPAVCCAEINGLGGKLAQ